MATLLGSFIGGPTPGYLYKVWKPHLVPSQQLRRSCFEQLWRAGLKHPFTILSWLHMGPVGLNFGVPRTLGRTPNKLRKELVLGLFLVLGHHCAHFWGPGKVFGTLPHAFK